MTSTIDLFWSFRSPYSYLATPGALQLLEDFSVEIQFRPVLPLAIREPDFFSPSNIKRAKYIALDFPRRAEMLGVAHSWPSPDPIVQDMKTYEIATEQPYIYRLSYLGVEAQRLGRGIQFAAEISKLIFSGTRDWHLGEHLREASARAGLNLDEMDSAISNSQSYFEEVASSQRALEQSGHWGVPTFVYNSEPFFGEDRIDSLRWQLEKDNLSRK